MQWPYHRFVAVGFYFIGQQPADDIAAALQKPKQARLWRAHFGACPRTAFRMWNLILLRRFTHDEAKKLDPFYYLMALHFLKVYPTNDALAGRTWRDPQTVRIWIWRYISLMASLSSVLVRYPLFFCFPPVTSHPTFF